MSASIKSRILPSVMKRANSSSSALKHTPLYDLHVNAGATIVPFAGFSMPLQYKDQTISASHRWTREHSGLFDVSHMVQWFIRGENATAYLESITPSSLKELAPFHSTLSAFTNEQGGIIDDTIIAKHDDNTYYVVTNAACSVKDEANLKSHLENWKGVELERVQDRALIAIQGPETATVIQSLAPSNDFSALKFGQSAYVDFKGIRCLVSRGGYTGEDGFEISVPADASIDFAQSILANKNVRPIGLGARDTLRLEAGMCLYGSDIDDTTSPVEGSLSWIVGKRRREENNFIGSSRILKEIKEGASRRRVGFIIENAPARHGSIIEVDGVQVGNITSGCPSPSLSKNIAMGYVTTGFHKTGTSVHVKVRNKLQPATVVRMPFVPSKYYR
ncbi:glycine decarboxylase T subunit [Schizosaccharomyces octosporus yFS286]|uniref:Aminomethyltransferase n=1 Tax=Schizosaccharomyces octosporus (strain yFS286) TaxID=483514 RepID=S9PU19_SCHOY|nr:glycine decarboxylase T subunit [Schizosaccharomyces octosporus yFS286]EPX71467.1 glycine decarboxylase T subunit [Schizosaccharomyces octosporus yFS286]